MRFNIYCLLLLTFIVVNHSQANVAPKKEENEGRLYFSTFTVILSTVTSTTTIGTTTTCTTSTSALKTCSVGRRRRGLFYDDAENQGRARRGLFYNDDEDYINKDGNSSPVKRSADPIEESPNSSVTIDNNWIPLTVQSGFSMPDGFPAGIARFKLAYGTSTVTTTTTSTATRSLTATCASTTSFQICSGVGK